MHQVTRCSFTHPWYKHALIAAASLCLMTGFHIKDAVAVGTDLAVHQVVEGDTLIGLAKKYLDDGDLWPLFLQYNKVENPRRLKPGSEIRIPPIELPRINVIFKHGEVLRSEGGNSETLPLDVGDQLQEGDHVNVGSDSYLTLQFADGSIIRVLPDSVLRVQRYREPGPSKASSRIMALERGDLDISVVPKTSDGKSRKTKPNQFEVITPRAVAAVRGTRFDVSASELDTTSGVTEGNVAIRQNTDGKRGKQAVLSAGTGIHIDDQGKLGQVRPLLAATDLSTLPTQLNRSDYVLLDWADLADAASYQVRVATDEQMNEVVASGESPSSSVKLTDLADGKYIVGVRAVDPDGIIGFEAKHTVDIQAQPAFPFYLGPAHQQIVGKVVNLECTPVVGATAYRLQISRSADFESTVVDADQLETCSFTGASLDDGSYFWRAAALMQDAEGQFKQGPYGAPSQFEVNQSANTPTSDRPTSAYWLEDQPLSFTAQISPYEDFSEILNEQALESNQLPLENLAAGLYFIRLKATDNEGFTTAYSAPRMVEIKQVEETIERTWADKPK